MYTVYKGAWMGEEPRSGTNVYGSSELKNVVRGQNGNANMEYLWKKY